MNYRALAGAGIKPGDRVTGYLPNMPETIAAMLAASSLGAVWSSCSPDFGVSGVLDRFGQIEPKILFAADGYRYNARRHDCLAKTAEIAAGCPSIEKVVIVPYGDQDVSTEAVSQTVPGAVSWGDFTAGLFEAKDAGFETVLLCDHDGNVTEGPGFNAFAVKGDRVVTPDLGVLEGVTRRTALEMARALGMQTEERALPLEEFLEADEVFLSSSGGGVLPITRVDDRVFGNGRPGPVATRLNALYWDWTRRPDLRTEVDYRA